ncbi:helix-turn-helix domain-containing protein [Anaerococcus nagyae]|uniref:helix-turn-helix domain-containing protein n=1 Tax=Anaerococcus nagyae TaxID=1755241 RepID=UPI001AE76D0C|nr:helix-turn-helix domain-containing protein [Anaerococcus nagyae]MBP2069053.1 transcriptional regulator with XRE-family HTH domain [Anaerococcus nagyae]
MDYNLDYIGNEIRNIRKEKKLTQEDLAFAADLSVDTIRRLESGKVDIKLSSLLVILEELGLEFDTIFNYFQGSIWSYIDDYITDLDYYMDEFNYEKVEETLGEFEKVNKDILPNFYQKKYSQYLKFYQSIIYNPKRSSQSFIKGLNEAMVISHKDFKIKKYKNYNYTNFEYRILSAMVPYYRENGDIGFSYDILLFILNNIGENNNLYPKISYNISRSYSNDGDVEKALEWNKKSIDSSIRNNDTINLINSYYQRGDILFKEKNPEFLSYLNKSMDLCLLTNRPELKEKFNKLIYRDK